MSVGKNDVVVLWFGDIFGKPGRKAIKAALPELKNKYNPDFIIGNAENLAGGRGVNRRTFSEMMEMGFDAMTSGNHIWDNREVVSIFESDHRLLRPANFPNPPQDRCPGTGYETYEKNGKKLTLINIMGRLFMDALDCPFQAVDKILKENTTDCPILVDMHADATSEKSAMGWFLNGRVSGVFGSHSHVQTADEQILPGGTAYITDVGMSGSFNSSIGMRPDEVIKRFISKRRVPIQPGRENPGVSCLVVHIGSDKRAKSITRLRFAVQNVEGMDGGDLE